MPQVFGADQIGLISQASLFSEAGFIEDVDAHEEALRGAGFDDGNLPVRMDRSGFHPRGAVFGQHLTSDKAHHTWAIARVANPEVNPNARETDVGGPKSRYAVEIHKVPVDPSNARTPASVTPIWEGNDIRQFVHGQRIGPDDKRMTWPRVQQAMMRGPRKR